MYLVGYSCGAVIYTHLESCFRLIDRTGNLETRVRCPMHNEPRRPSSGLSPSYKGSNDVGAGARKSDVPIAKSPVTQRVHEFTCCRLYGQFSVLCGQWRAMATWPIDHETALWTTI